MPSTHAPRMMVRMVRIATGRPEKGTSIVRTPSSISMLGRDISVVYRH